MNVINGGAHADNRLDPQEFMVCPVGFTSFAEALRAGAEVFHTPQGDPQEEGPLDRRRRRGRFCARHRLVEGSDRAAAAAIEAAGHKPGRDIVIALDPAASEFYEGGKYVLKGEKKTLSSDGMIRYWADLVAAYPIASIEDGLAEGDWKGWQALTKELGTKILLVGDDVFVTNPEILARGIADGVGNALLVKLNQIGTLTETLDAVRMAQTSRLPDHRLAPLGRDARRHDRGPRGRGQLRPDQDGLGLPRRAPREVQPPARDRRGARGRRDLRGPRGLPAMKADDDADAPRGPRPMTAFLVSLAISSVIMGVLLLSDRRVLELRRARTEVRTLDKQIVERRAENEALRAVDRGREPPRIPGREGGARGAAPGSARRRRPALPGGQPDEAGRHARPRGPRGRAAHAHRSSPLSVPA